MALSHSTLYKSSIYLLTLTFCNLHCNCPSLSSPMTPLIITPHFHPLSLLSLQHCQHTWLLNMVRLDHFSFPFKLHSHISSKDFLNCQEFPIWVLLQEMLHHSVVQRFDFSITQHLPVALPACSSYYLQTFCLCKPHPNHVHRCDLFDTCNTSPFINQIIQCYIATIKLTVF